MNKLLSTVGLAISLAMVSLLAGCQLYFGDSDSRGDRPGAGSDDRPPGFECDSNAQCAAGCFCGPDGKCEEAGFCDEDKDCGEGFECDEPRASCIPKPEPQGTCGGAITCSTGGPKCAEGQVPVRLNGCYTGECRAISACEAAPACNALQHEGDCVARGGAQGDCSPVYNGQGCRNPEGGTCVPGGPCTCTIHTFTACEAKPATGGFTVIPMD